MDFLNIWIGKEIPLKRKRCIRSFIAKMQAHDTHTLISYNDYHGILSRCINPAFWHVYSQRAVQYMADFMRLQLATENPQLFYADTDILLGNNFDMDFKKPGAYIGQWGAGAETFLFYVNDDCNFFKELMFHVEQFNPKELFLPFVLQEFFRKKKNKFNLIDENTFSHLRLSGAY